MPTGLGYFVWPTSGRRLGQSDAPLDLPDAVEILVQLGPVGGAEVAADPGGVFSDEIEDALALPLAPPADGLVLRRVGAAEEALEDESRVGLLGRRRRRAAPGQVGLVGAAVAVVAGPAALASLTADLQRRKAGRLADAVGGHLIDRDAGPQVRAVGLAGVGPGQEGRHRPGMVAAAVAVGAGRVEGQPAQDQDLVTDPLQRSQDAGQLEARTDPGRGPIRQVDAVWDVEERSPGRGRRRRPGFGRGNFEREHRFQQRQGDRRPQAPQCRAPAERPRLPHGLPPDPVRV
jgi:hypothetical protein